MLKALEIAGFKSFADRARLEFPQGITAVVGPNGSGKSNIVDAIKWVLGEQSVKSLRGREMADVIFNGSGSRRALNAAEVTLVFDNANHLLDIDAPEVGITRRVYRSGEGEYLINRNPARLRDIRDLLSGTGMGTQAYSVIEQGKVDVLLQSSPRDRREIFEEAAGISRFKVRKIEALRRLERVDQNLLRLSDIVDEVENRLRGVRSQAGKARRYKEYADRLQELRTQVGQADWKRLTERLDAFEAELRGLVDERGKTAIEAENAEARRLDADGRMGEVVEAIRQAELQIAANRERIAAAEATVEHERRRGDDLEQEIADHRRQLGAMSARAGNLQQQWLDTTEALQAAQQNQQDVARRLVEAERSSAEAAAKVESLRANSERRRSEHLQTMRAAAALGNEISSLESQVAAAETVRQRCAARAAELDRAIDALQTELDTLRRQRLDATQRAEEHGALLAAANQRLAEHQRQLAAKQGELAEMRERLRGAVERAAVLDELVRRHEGLGAGVKEVLERAAKADPVFANIHGVVADLLHVSVEVAPLVEIALGPIAHHVVALPSVELLNFLQTDANRLGGRVGFVWLEEGSGARVQGSGGNADIHDSPEGRPGVIGRADRFAEASATLAPLVERLLGRTWFVEKLSHAFSLAHDLGPRWTFVTLAGDLLEPDGTLTVGPRNLATGLISRRSQLRALQGQIAELEAALDATQRAAAHVEEQIAAQRQMVERCSAERQQATDALAENRVALGAADERRAELDRQRVALERERNEAESQHAAAVGRLAPAVEKRRALDAAVAEMESSLASLDEEIERVEAVRATAARETTEIKVEAAKSEERLRNLRARMKQFEESREERDRAIREGRDRLNDAVEREEASRRSILRAEAEIADLYLHKEAFADETVRLIDQREALRAQRDALAADGQKAASRSRKLEEKIHAVELAANEARLERTTMADRLREDYGIETAELERATTDEEQRQRDEVQREIEELRQKINNLGNVNLESLDELEQLETRYKTLHDQHQDLTSAKTSLEKIIDKINADSRRLFSETLETVRGHFQTLFRDLFGGGQADIVLEESVDILDSGVEIVARPPGKEPRSISLLSGGEKTMTCVALLLAIFRSRPSPFCVLDEVDAALDEANIDRFTQVLKDFLAWTQFIIITHSKKTMTCANTIYGVTMQESGVTKQVSVRFEDVSDDGRLLADQPRDQAA